MRVHDLAVADDDRALDGVLELADVPRPVICHEHVDGRRRDALDVLAVRERCLLEEMIREQQQVRFPLAERRKKNREHIEAVVQVFAEAAVANRRLDVLVRRGNQAHVGANRFRAAKPLELARLDAREAA